MGEKAVAILTLRGAQRWTKRGRKSLAEWLQHQAEVLLADGPQYSELFTARYLVDTEKPRHVQDFKIEPAEPVV